MNTNEMIDLLRQTDRTNSFTKDVINDLLNAHNRLTNVKPGVAIFGSAREPEGTALYNSAYKLGSVLAGNKISVVTGGGPGIMEAANKGAFETGGVSVGVNIELPHEQISNAFVTHSVTVTNFLPRKAIFMEYSKAFVVYPGGFGTLDELADIITMAQTRKIQQQPIILYGSGFWEGMLSWMRNTMLPSNFVSSTDLDIMKITDDPMEIASYLKNLF